MRNGTEKSGHDAGGAIATIAVGAVLLKMFSWLARWALIGGAIAGVVWLVRRIGGGQRMDDDAPEVQYAPSAAGISLVP